MKKAFIIAIVVFGISIFGCMPRLHEAAKSGDINAVKELLDNGGNTDERGSNGETALHWAAGGGHNDIVKLLLDRGTDVNAVHSGGFLGGIWNFPYWTPLADAAYSGRSDTVNLLLDKGADLDLAILALERNGTSGSQPAITLLRRLEQKRAATQFVKSKVPAEATPSPPVIVSDVDDPPPSKFKQNKNAYAIVIGIESYRHKLPKADFAAHDAETVTKYLTKVIGYQEENVVTLLNDRALQSDMAKYFEKWLPNNVGQGSTVFVYYSGHGAPNPKTGDAFLVPYDGDPTFIDQTGYSLKRLYENLNKLPSKEILVVLDSCFSGAGGRSVVAKGARPLVINMDKIVLSSGKINVLSAASDDQISSSYDVKGHGLFTYFMLKGIKNEDVMRPDGTIMIDDLFAYVKPQVERVARRQYNNEQSPQIIVPKKEKENKGSVP